MNGANSAASKINIRNLLKGQGSLIAFFLLFICATFAYENFFTYQNLTNVLRQVSMIGMVSVGITFVILTGGIDLSVGSMVALSSILCAALSSTNLVLAIICPIVLCTALGFINGLMVTKMKIVPFIATLAMLMGVRGIVYIATNETSIRLAESASALTWLGRGYFLGLPVPAWVLIIFVIICTFVSKLTKIGRYIYAVGGNEEASRMMGLNVDKVKIVAYAVCGLMSGLAGIIMTARQGAGQPTAAETWEMMAIASVVIGGTQLTGGQGKFTGTFIGILILGMITNIFNMQGNLNTWWQSVVMGSILIVVVVIQAQANKRKIH